MHWISDILIPACVQFLPCSCSYHEVTSDIWLEDLIKGAPGEWAAVKVEDLRHVVQAVVIMPTASYYQRGLGVVGRGFVLFSTGRVEYPVQSYVLNMAGRIAGVSDGRRVTLRLRDRKRHYKLQSLAPSGAFQVPLQLSERHFSLLILLTKHTIRSCCTH